MTSFKRVSAKVVVSRIFIPCVNTYFTLDIILPLFYIA